MTNQEIETRICRSGSLFCVAISMAALLGACADAPGAFVDAGDTKSARGPVGIKSIYPVDPHTHVTTPGADPMNRDTYQTRVANAVAYARYAAAQYDGSAVEDIEDVEQIAALVSRLASESGVSFADGAKYHLSVADERAYEEYREEVYDDILGFTGDGRLPRLGARIMDGYEKLYACQAGGYDAAQCCQALAWFEGMVSAGSAAAAPGDETADYDSWTSAVMKAEHAAVAAGDQVYAQPFNHLGLKAWLSYCGGSAQDIPTTLDDLRYRFGDYRVDPDWVVELHPVSLAKQAGRRIFRRRFSDGSVMSIADTLGEACGVRETEVIFAVPDRAQQFWSFDAHGRNVHHGHFPVRKGVEAVRFTPDACLGCHYEFDARRFNVMAPSFDALHLILKSRDGVPQWTDHTECATPRDLIVRHAAKVQDR